MNKNFFLHNAKYVKKRRLKMVLKMVSRTSYFLNVLELTQRKIKKFIVTLVFNRKKEKCIVIYLIYIVFKELSIKISQKINYINLF